MLVGRPLKISGSCIVQKKKKTAAVILTRMCDWGGYTLRLPRAFCSNLFSISIFLFSHLVHRSGGQRVQKSTLMVSFLGKEYVQCSSSEGKEKKKATKENGYGEAHLNNYG